MNPIELTPEEAETLNQVLRRCVSDLELEILHTDHGEFKKLLKQRREVLQRILARTEPPSSPTPG